MKWDLVSDWDARACHNSAYGLVGPVSLFRLLWSLVLDRQLSEAEALEIVSKACYGPIPYELTWEAIQRSESVANFWRTPGRIAG